MSASDERRRILDLLDNGIITAEQAIQLLESVEGEDELDDEEDPVLESTYTADEAMVVESLAQVNAGATATAQATAMAEVTTPVAGEGVDAEAPIPEDAPAPESGESESPFDAGQAGWRRWWQWPLWIGVGVTVVAAGLMYLAYQGSGFGFWFACTWFPFLLGVLLMALAWASRSARWVHVRVQQRPGERPERIAISLPIPLSLTVWALRTFGRQVPGMNKINPEDMILALRNVTPETPFYVKVDEGDDGEKVEVYIG